MNLRNTFFLLGVVFILGCQTKTVKPLLDVEYQSRLSDDPVLIQTIPTPGKSAMEIKEAVLTAAAQRGWEVKELSEDSIEAKLIHRKYDSTLTFNIMDGGVDIRSVSYKIDKTTRERIKREEPEGWIRNLNKDVLRLLDLLPES